MTIVVGYDGRLEGRDAVALGASLARAVDEPLLVASVHQSPETTFGLTAAELRAEAERTAAEGAAQVPADLERQHVAVLGRSPAQGLHDLAEEQRPTALVVGSTRRPARPHDRRKGRVAPLRGAPCPVAVAPRGAARRDDTQLRTISVGFDDSPESWNAIQRAAALGLAAGATLRVIHALHPVIAPPMAPEESERADPRATRQPGARAEPRRRERIQGPARRAHSARWRSGPRARTRGKP